MESIANVDVYEIEITPEMVERGVDLLVSYDPRFESEEDFTRRFLVALRCTPSKTDL